MARLRLLMIATTACLLGGCQPSPHPRSVGPLLGDGWRGHDEPAGDMAKLQGKWFSQGVNPDGRRKSFVVEGDVETSTIPLLDEPSNIVYKTRFALDSRATPKVWKTVEVVESNSIPNYKGGACWYRFEGDTLLTWSREYHEGGGFPTVTVYVRGK